jgi:hypothetical protein
MARFNHPVAERKRNTQPKRKAQPDVLGYVTGQLDEDDTIAQFQASINSGLAWRLEGSYGREAMACIERGDCILGEVGHRDYYGNYVPSRYEVQPGTKGSVEYAQRMQESR